jgi:tetratricopeptide (TPR) repeat protein
MKIQITLALLLNTLFINQSFSQDFNISVCNAAVDQGNASQALTLSNAALEKNKADKDAYICKGRASSALGNLPEATAAFKLAAENSQDAFDKVIINILSGNAYANAKQYELAIGEYRTAVTHAQSSKNQKFERIGQNLIGDAYLKLNQLDQALTAYGIGNKLAENDNERGESYENLALTHHLLKHHDQALEYQIKAYFMHERVGTLDQYAHSGIELGRYYTEAKNYSSAENTLNKIMSFAKNQGGAYYEAQAKYMLAKVKAATGDMASAKQLIAEAQQIAVSTKDAELEREIKQETQGLL